MARAIPAASIIAGAAAVVAAGAARSARDGGRQPPSRIGSRHRGFQLAKRCRQTQAWRDRGLHTENVG